MDPANALNTKQIFFTNLLLLGFDPTTMERKWRILFNKDMFDLPNKKAFEVVMYFLFERLSPTKCRNEFRDCWPVHDKKTEHEFRKVCNNWLLQISKDEPDSHLPRIIASTFFAPGGAKFYQLLFSLSKFILIKVMAQEHGLRQREFLRPPVLTPGTIEMSVAMERALECATIRSRRAFVKQVQQTGLAQEQWHQCAGELVKEYRRLKKTNHDKERAIRRLVQETQEANNMSMTGSPMGKCRKGFDFDLESVQRAQMLQKVREMWKCVESFVTGRRKAREVVSAVLSDEDERCTVDARHLNVRVPDMLLRTCEQEIQRRNVDNIYDGGKLNLLSLVHLSNLCLHLFIEKLHQVGLPDLEEAVPEVTAQLHRHQVHLANTKELEKKVETQLIPGIKASIKELKERLDSAPTSSQSPAPLRLQHRGVWNSVTRRRHKSKKKALDLQLTAPTPPVNFDPAEPGDTFGASFLEQLSKPLDSAAVSTPDAATQLMTSVRQQVLYESPTGSRSSTGHRLPQGRPVYAPTARITDQQPLNTGKSRLPTRTSQNGDIKQSHSAVATSEKLLVTDGGTRRQPCGDEAPARRQVQSSKTFSETHRTTTDSAKQRLYDHITPQKSNQEVQSSSDSNDSFLEWLNSSGRLTLTGSTQPTEGTTDTNQCTKHMSEGFVITSTPHDNPLAHTTLSINVTPPHGATPTHGAMATQGATPTHSNTSYRATPTHGATPTYGVSPQTWSDTGHGHKLGANDKSVKHRTPYSPVVTTLFPEERPEEDKRSANSHDNVPTSSTDQQIDALVDHVMSDSRLQSFFTADGHADQLMGVYRQSLSSTASPNGQAVGLGEREDVSASVEWHGSDDMNSGVKTSGKQSFLDALVNMSYREEQERRQEDSEEEFIVEEGERMIEVQDGSFNEFYVKTPSKSWLSADEQKNQDVQLTISSLKQRMMQMQMNDGEAPSTSKLNGNSTMDAGHTFEHTARASSDIGNLIARYQQLRANSHVAASSESRQLLVPNTPPNSRSSHSTVVLSPPNSLSTTPSPPPPRVTPDDHVIGTNTRLNLSELEVASWPMSHQEGSDRRSVATAPPDLTDQYNYDELISLSESVREKAAAIRDNAARQTAIGDVSGHDTSLLLDDDFIDIQAQLQSMSPYSGSPSPVRLTAGASRSRSAGKRPELTVGLSATPMSQLTSSLHQVDDILDEHDSILIPTSPPVNNPESASTGCLVDLSF